MKRVYCWLCQWLHCRLNLLSLFPGFSSREVWARSLFFSKMNRMPTLFHFINKMPLFPEFKTFGWSILPFHKYYSEIKSRRELATIVGSAPQLLSLRIPVSSHSRNLRLTYPNSRSPRKCHHHGQHFEVDVDWWRIRRMSELSELGMLFRVRVTQNRYRVLLFGKPFHCRKSLRLILLLSRNK